MTICGPGDLRSARNSYRLSVARSKTCEPMFVWTRSSPIGGVAEKTRATHTESRANETCHDPAVVVCLVLLLNRSGSFVGST